MSSVKEVDSDDHAFWQLVIESQAGSGLSVKKFCENEGINPSSFYQWRKKLEQRVFSASLHDMNYCGWYFVRRQEYGIMRTTYEESVKIECTGPVGPRSGAF